MGISHTAIAILRMPRSNKEVSSFAQSIVTAMTGNPSFPAPTPTLAVVSGDIVAFVAAEAAALARTKGTADTRDVKLATLRTDLEHLFTLADEANYSGARVAARDFARSLRPSPRTKWRRGSAILTWSHEHGWRAVRIRKAQQRKMFDH